MTDKGKTGTETDKDRRRFKSLWIVPVGVVVIVGLLAWEAGLLDSRSIDEQFAAIDAKLAIPDSENAAVHLQRFLTNPDNAVIMDDLSSLSPSAYVEPWASSDNPGLAAEITEHRAFMQTLLDACKMPKARFQVYPDPSDDSWQMLRDMRRLTFILSSVAANDLAEGRTDAALSKYRCQMQLARHLEEQPATLYSLVGIAIEAVALGNIRRAVMRDEVTPEQLMLLEQILVISQDQDTVDTETVARVNRLVREKELSQMSTLGRLRQLWFGRKELRAQEQRRRLIHLRRQATRRATPILIALRRHKERTGAWPDTLEDIEPKLPAQTLIDPQNEGPFVYKRDGDSFVFYSVGPNKIDESGSSKKPADDWPIWPVDIK